MFLPGESQGQGSLVGCCLWGCTESDTIEATWQQQQQQFSGGCYLQLNKILTDIDHLSRYVDLCGERDSGCIIKRLMQDSGAID